MTETPRPPHEALRAAAERSRTRRGSRGGKTPTSSTSWVKARDTLLIAAPHEREMPDGRRVEAEASLVLTLDGGQTVVIEGSYKRLLKTLDHARTTLLDTAPALQHVTGAWLADDSGEVDVLEGDRLLAAQSEGWELTTGLRCPHPDCGAVTWDGEEQGIRVVDLGERWHPFGYSAERSAITGHYDHDTDFETDRYECESCERPVSLPEGVEESGS